MFDLAGKTVWVAGQRGMVGGALLRRFRQEDCDLVVETPPYADLRDPAQVRDLLGRERIDAIVVAAGRVGGILANATRPGEFIYDNLMIAANIVHAAHQMDIDRLLYLGSSCIYPRLASQPMREDALMTGPLESTNAPYAMAKLAGLHLIDAYRRQYGRNYIAALPTNLYGPGDNFDPVSSHVLPALIARAHAARVTGAPSLTIWGSGMPRREFLHVDDCADALVHLLRSYSGEMPINIGVGSDQTILETTKLICSVVGYDGAIHRDLTLPDGTPRKLLDTSRLTALGWHPTIDLPKGIAQTYDWYREALAAGRISMSP